jgi:DtxR family Mn-dependent transcriptional regulator
MKEVEQMTPNREDYLKLIFELGGDTNKISNKQIVAGINVSAASVSEMISKLVKEKLVEHVPYQGVQLTESGLQKASTLIRKHRLWEVFLVEHLKFQWNEVHDEAEILEHATSKTLATHLDEYLHFPEYCPHGGIIPKDGQAIHETRHQTLIDFPVGTSIQISRVLDEKALLDYLVQQDVRLNEQYKIIDIASYEGPVTIQNEEKTIALSYKAASTIFVTAI